MNSETSRPTTWAELRNARRGWTCGTARAYIGLLIFGLACFGAASYAFGDKTLLHLLLFDLVIVFFTVIAAIRNKEYPLLPALKSDYINPNYPAIEGKFVLKRGFLFGVVAVSVSLPLAFAIVSVVFLCFEPDFVYLSQFLWLTGLSAVAFTGLVIWVRQSLGRLNCEWEAYVAARDSVSKA